MLKHLLVGSLALSSIALAGPPAPLPSHGARPPPPTVERRVDRDDARALQLLRTYDAAVTRRDLRAMAEVSRQLDALLAKEIREAKHVARVDPRARQTLKALTRIEQKLERLPARGRGTVLERRNLYAELVKVAQRDAFNGFGGRRA